jgi:hypothetical protein
VDALFKLNDHMTGEIELYAIFLREGTVLLHGFSEHYGKGMFRGRVGRTMPIDLRTKILR